MGLFVFHIAMGFPSWSKAQSRGQEEVSEATATKAVHLGARQLLRPGFSRSIMASFVFFCPLAL